MKMPWKGKNQQNTPTLQRKDGTSTYVSRREELKNRKLRKKGLIK